VVRGKFIQSFAAQNVNVVNSLVIHPSFGVVTGSGTAADYGGKKTNVMHELWRFYRFKSLKFRWLHGSASTPGMYIGAASFTSGDMSVAQSPGNIDDVYEQSHQFAPITFISANTYSSTAPISAAQIPSVPKLESVPRRELFGRVPTRWYYCDPTSTNVSDALIFQGRIWSTFTAETGNTGQNCTYSYEIAYEIEFSEFLLATVSTFARSLGYDKSDRSRVLKEKTLTIEEHDEKSDDELDDASLHIIAESSDGFGGRTIGKMPGSPSHQVSLREVQLLRAKIARLEDQLIGNPKD
jgi:hypothetical protein